MVLIWLDYPLEHYELESESYRSEEDKMNGWWKRQVMVALPYYLQSSQNTSYCKRSTVLVGCLVQLHLPPDTINISCSHLAELCTTQRSQIK